MSEILGGPELPQLPAPTLQKLRAALQLLAEVESDFGEPGLPPLGPGPDDGPVTIPSLPNVHQLEDDLQRIIDLLRGLRPAAPSALQIADVEMTQSTQYFNLDGLSSGAGADNSVPLIANKVTVLRVYVGKRAGKTGYVPAQFTGEVRVAGQVIQPLNGPLALQERGALRRSNLNHTLNFRIPANLCVGLRDFEVRIYDPDASRILVGLTPTGGRFGRSTTKETFGTYFRPMAAMKLQGVLISYSGPNLPAPPFNLPAPAGTALVSTVARFLPMFPIPAFDFGPCTTWNLTSDLRIQPGTAGSGWDIMLSTLASLRTASTIRTYFVGLLPKGLPVSLGSFTLGIGRLGCAMSSQDNTRALSHELGHATGLRHLNDGVAPPLYDLNYPNYGTFPYTSIGEYGLDTARMTLFDPNSDRDFMGYFDAADTTFPANTWISPYNYVNVMTAIKSTAGTGDIVFAEGGGFGSAMMLNFRLYRGGRAELQPSWLVTGVRPLTGRPADLPVRLEVLGRGDEILSSTRCHLHNVYQDPEGPFLDFHELVPWTKEATGFAVVRDGRTLDTIRLEGHAPKVELSELRRVRKEADLARLGWTIDGGAIHSALVRYSPDDGRTWYALAANVTETSYLVNLDLLPSGEQCRLEVTVSSGLHSTAVLTEPFVVPPKPRKAHLVSPEEGEVFPLGASVAFLGAGHSADGGTCELDEVTWHSNRQGLLGTGYHLVREDLQPGLHRITLSLPDGHRGEASAAVWIRVTDERACGPRAR